MCIRDRSRAVFIVLSSFDEFELVKKAMQLGARDYILSLIHIYRTLQDYVKAFVACGFSVTDLTEPIPTQNQIKKFPGLGWLQKIPLFLFWELEKKRGGNGEG